MLLNVVADFMQSYAKISVKVTGHCNRLADDELTKFGKLSDQLTERQAAAVAAYLVSQHINARFIYAVGRGNRDPIAWEGSRQGRHLNRRVEISFRYYRDNTAWY
jgi:outer membrane protein OmpA-like peptidoglycan-associated protein